MIHEAWDFETLNVLGQLTHQKTIRTTCGKRVAFGSTSNTPTCPDCIKAQAEREEFLRKMQNEEI